MASVHPSRFSKMLSYVSKHSGGRKWDYGAVMRRMLVVDLGKSKEIEENHVISKVIREIKQLIERSEMCINTLTASSRTISRRTPASTLDLETR